LGRNHSREDIVGRLPALLMHLQIVVGSRNTSALAIQARKTMAGKSAWVENSLPEHLER
jgi:hypothetical protein